jgi:hypothetical protein
VAIAFVQEKASANSASLTLSANTTVGNSLIVAVGVWATSNKTISANAPTLGGSAVTGAVLLTSKQSPFASSATVWAGLFLLPDVQVASEALTFTGNNNDGESFLAAIEYSGLGASPTNSTTPASASGNSASVSSGASGALAAVPAVVAGLSDSTGSPFTSVPGAPWTSYELNTGGGALGYQIITSGTSTYTWAPSAALSDPWAAMVCAVEATATSQTVALTTPNVALAAPLPSVDADGTVALTAPNVALAAPLVTPLASDVVSLTAPNVALAAPLLSVSGGATVLLTAPNVALAAPLVTPLAGAAVTLTAPGVTLAAPLVSVQAGATVALTAPGISLAAPLLTPSAAGSATVALTAPGISLAAPLLAPSGNAPDSPAGPPLADDYSHRMRLRMRRRWM